MNRFDYQKPLKLIFFYYRILGCFPVLSSAIILSGFVYRILNIAIFVLIMKIFLIVIDPEAVLPLVEKMTSLLPFEVKINLEQLPIVLLGVLAGIIVVHFIIGRLNLSWMLKARKKLQVKGPTLDLHKNLANKRNMCLDQLPVGLDAIVKISEILIFFVFVISAILYMAPVVGILVFISTPLLISYLILKSRENAFLIIELRESRQKIGRLSEEEYLKPVSQSNLLFSSTRTNLISSDFFGGIIIVGIILVFLFYMGDDSVSNFSGLILIFSIRFAFIYAKECSVVLGNLLQQRTVMAEVVEADIDVSALNS